jgi:hypothetical protein
MSPGSPQCSTIDLLGLLLGMMGNGRSRDLGVRGAVVLRTRLPAFHRGVPGSDRLA